MLYSNYHTIVTVSEFLANPRELVENTIERKADLIILEDETGIEVSRMNWWELEYWRVRSEGSDASLEN
jgi:hypothetical protein